MGSMSLSIQCRGLHAPEPIVKQQNPVTNRCKEQAHEALLRDKVRPREDSSFPSFRSQQEESFCVRIQCLKLLMGHIFARPDPVACGRYVVPPGQTRLFRRHVAAVGSKCPTACGTFALVSYPSSARGTPQGKKPPRHWADAGGDIPSGRLAADPMTASSLESDTTFMLVGGRPRPRSSKKQNQHEAA